VSVEAIATVLHHSRATGTAKVVLIGIANHAGDGGAWPSIATLSKYAGVDERTVQRAIRKLEELGEIRVHAQSGGTRNTQDRYRPNRYDILVACPADCDRTPAHNCATDDAETQPNEASNRGDTGVTPHHESGVTPTSPLQLVRGDASVASWVTPTSPEPSLNHPDTPQPPASGGPTSSTPICGRHPDGGGKNCRACGTTSKQLAERRDRELEAQRRAEQQRRDLEERARNEQLRSVGPSPATAAALQQIRQTLAGAAR
jgi:hypothetical protein